MTSQKDMTQPVVAGFKADDLYQVVGGVLRSGDRINIYQVNENANKGDTSQSLANTDDNWTDASSDTAASLYGEMCLSRKYLTLPVR